MNAADIQKTNLRSFLIIWASQVASILGSEMTNFAVTIWAWNITGKATSLSLIILFTQIPRLIAALFAGILVDRCDRKLLMILGDTAAGISTIAIFILLTTNHLEIWHLYLTAAFSGLFGYFQHLAYSASISALVAKQHYTRAAAMCNHVGQFGSNIIAPGLAGALYYVVGLQGILTIDIATFAIALCTIYFVQIPQPVLKQEPEHQKLWQNLTFGWRYIFKNPNLRSLLIFLLIFNFLDYSISGIHASLILSRSHNNTAVFASVQSAIGLGGVIGAVSLSVWGGFKRRIHGMLLGTVLSYGCMVLFGLGNLPATWILAGFFTAVFWSSISSSEQAIWLSKVPPEVQGRVFANRYLLTQLAAPIGLAIAGPLADKVFKPAMLPGGILANTFGGLFGNDYSSGIALQYTLFAFCGVLLGLSGYTWSRLRNIELVIPDYEVNNKSTNKL